MRRTQIEWFSQPRKYHLWRIIWETANGYQAFVLNFN